MCLTPIVDYVPRPVKPAERPAGGAPSLAEQDENLFGPKPTPPQWQEVEVTESQHAETSTTAAADTATVAAAIAGIGSGTRRVESLLVELPSGRRLLITEL